jgi:hypothetical protein
MLFSGANVYPASGACVDKHRRCAKYQPNA